MKKVFVSGTWNPSVLNRLAKKIKFLEYEPIIIGDGKPDPFRKDRIKALLDCDSIANPYDTDWEHYAGYKMEKDLAQFLQKEFLYESKLDQMIVNKVIP